ncbi:hypothetical protein OG809_02770 [Kribbella soli]
MTWPDGAPGRALAATYLIALPATYVGVAWLFILEWSGDGSWSGAPLVIFAVGVLTITALSLALRDHVPERPNRLTKNWSGYQRAYHRLALGFEVKGAWRVVRGIRVA